MYKILTIQSDNEADLALIRQIAQRLGLSYQETKVENGAIPSEAVATEPTASLLDGLNLPQHSKSMRYEDIPQKVNLEKYQTYEPQPLFEVLEEYGGAWEEDDESLEDLLNLLTP